MIEVEHLSKTYGSTAAIADVSFSVESGEILGFLGPNGAGKTTTMRILSGYLPASSGTARIAGFDVHENSMAVRQRIGYLPENPPLYPEMSVEGFLFFVARIKQVPAGDRARRVTSAIERCGLADKRKVLIRKLSKGFKQRVGIAQAIVHDPPVIILDEPTVGLDPRQIIEVRNLIKSLGGQHTIILSTHILPEVSMTCNRVTIINRGNIVAAGTPENLMGELASGSGYEVEVEGEADLLNTLLLPSLENVPGVRSVELIPSQQFLASRYRLRALCDSESEPGREISSTIIASGFGLCEMRRNRATLEDVFLKLTTTAEKKPGDVLIETEPEVAQNLLAANSVDAIADSHQSESPTLADNLQVSDRQESPYDSHSASPPVVETVESIEHFEPQSEPVAETLESISHHEPESEPVAEIVESISHHEPESEPVAEIVESISHGAQPEFEPVAETVESSEHREPEFEPVAETLESIEHREPEFEPVVEIVESIEHREPEFEPVAETVESIEHREPESEPVAETLESIEHSEPESEPVVETVESISHGAQPEFEPVVEIVELIEHGAQPESEPVVETVESISHGAQPEFEPVVEIVESISHGAQPEFEPVVETVESISHGAQPEFEPVVETVESISHGAQPESEAAETPEVISDLEPELQSVADFLEEVVERQESSEHSPPELIVDAPEAIAHSDSEPVTVENLPVAQTVPEPILDAPSDSEPVTLENLPVAKTVPEPILDAPRDSEPVTVENLQVTKTVPEPILDAHSDSEPVTLENLQVDQTVPETIVGAPSAIEDSQPKSQPQVKTVESSEDSPPKSQRTVKNRQLKKKPEPSSDSQPEQPPVNRKRQIPREIQQQENDDRPTTQPGDSESTN